MIINRTTDRWEEPVRLGFMQDSGQPLFKKQILDCCEPGRPIFARNYSYSVIQFAMRVFYLSEEAYYECANDALIENCRFYIEQKQCRDDRDSFYWSIDMLCRIVEFYGSNGSLVKNRLSGEAEELFLEMAYCWCKNNSEIRRANPSETWHIWESENHHVQGFTTCWHLSKLLMNSDRYCSRAYDDGFTPAEHFSAWNMYIKRWLSERGKKSLFVEIANGNYAAETLKGILNVYDFTADSKTKSLAQSLLHLYWATWAEEQISGVRGGGKTRVYPSWLTRGKDSLSVWVWYLMGIGELSPVSLNDYTAMTTSYRVAEVVIELAQDIQGRGTYEIKQRPLGLAQDGCYINPDYHLREDWGGILRYSYCTPQFIMGSLMCEPRPFTDWTMISSQNRFQGTIFSSHPDARIVPVPQCLGSGDTPVMRSYNQHYSIQNKGTLITQKLRTAQDTGPMRIWFSAAGGLNRFIEKENWIFTQTDGAFCALRILDGGYKTMREDGGAYVVCENGWSPVILEVADTTFFADMDSFTRKILSGNTVINGNRLDYLSAYGSQICFYTDYFGLPEADGIVSVHQSKMAYDSPFIQGEWDSELVTVQKGNKKMLLDFRV